MKLIKLILVSGVLVGCSSPPPPTPVDWDKAPAAMNGAIPEWKENRVINPAPNVNGKWSRVIKDFSDEKVYGIDVYYAVVHSSSINIITNDAGSFFRAKTWLQNFGAQAVINFKKNYDCITCSTTNIYLSNGIDVPVSTVSVKNLKKGTVVENKKSKETHVGIANKKQLAEPKTRFVDKTPVNVSANKGKNPFASTGTSEQLKSIASVKSYSKKTVTAPVVNPAWNVEVGTTLKDTLFRWAASQTCTEGGNWRVIWDTPVNYRIDAPLRFEGDFKKALNGAFGLYQYAQKPLYAFTNSTQCLIKVTDKG